MQIIQWFDESSWTQNVALGGNVFIIEGFYNTRDDSWYCSVLTIDETPVVLNVRVIIGIDLLANADPLYKPEGIILVVPMVDDVKEITKSNMGLDVQLVFAREDEILR